MVDPRVYSEHRTRLALSLLRSQASGRHGGQGAQHSRTHEEKSRCPFFYGKEWDLQREDIPPASSSTSHI